MSQDIPFSSLLDRTYIGGVERNTSLKNVEILYNTLDIVLVISLMMFDSLYSIPLS
jgi:hypothetical protein